MNRLSIVVAIAVSLSAMSGCSVIQEPHAKTVQRWCDGGRNAVLMAVNSRANAQKAMIKQDWSKEDRDFHNWGYDEDPIGEQWAATQWVYNLPDTAFLQVDARTIETEYVSYCNRVNQ